MKEELRRQFTEFVRMEYVFHQWLGTQQDGAPNDGLATDQFMVGLDAILKF